MLHFEKAQHQGTLLAVFFNFSALFKVSLFVFNRKMKHIKVWNHLNSVNVHFYVNFVTAG